MSFIRLKIHNLHMYTNDFRNSLYTTSHLDDDDLLFKWKSLLENINQFDFVKIKVFFNKTHERYIVK
jgi:hypothetical protein